ncbi:MAG: hypothetical protein ACRDZW_11425 [Acidimicrobiales bacterium]
MLSDETRQEWNRLNAAEDGPAAVLDRQVLAPFVIGLHQRGEEWTTHDLGLLLDEIDLAVADKDGVVAYVEAALALLAAYDVHLGAEQDEDQGEVEDEDGSGFGEDVPPGYLVI